MNKWGASDRIPLSTSLDVHRNRLEADSTAPVASAIDITRRSKKSAGSRFHCAGGFRYRHHTTFEEIGWKPIPLRRWLPLSTSLDVRRNRLEADSTAPEAPAIDITRRS
jgi:hypothetical protein